MHINTTQNHCKVSDYEKGITYRLQEHTSKKSYIGRKLLTLILILVIAFPMIPTERSAAAASESTITGERPTVAKVDNFTIKTKVQVDSTEWKYIDDSYNDVSAINEFWGYDNTYNIVFNDEENVYIQRLNQDMTEKSLLTMPVDLRTVGNAIQDAQGNYYIVYGKYDTAEMNTDASAGTAVVLSVVKYDNQGVETARVTYTGKETCPYEGVQWGTRQPFNFGQCDVIIDSSGILVCRYARVMYNGHQSSHSLYVDTATMTKLKLATPYNSHSFDQMVIETTDGSYLTVDRGDAYDRGFSVNRMNKSLTDVWEVASYVPFHFRNGYIYQTTYASLAGIAECSNGYALAGVSEKTLSYTQATEQDYNESRNLFLQVFRKDFSSYDTNQPGAQLLNGESRVAEGNYVSGTGNCEENAADYGVLWLTNYTDKEYASNPKMISIGNDQLLLMWEKKTFADSYAYEEEDKAEMMGSYYMVVDSSGNVVVPETPIQDLYLTQYGQPAYRDGAVYWTTSDGESKTVVVHRLMVNQVMPGAIRVNGIQTVDKVIVPIGSTVQLKAQVIPSNADNLKLIYTSEDDMVLTVSKDGKITPNMYYDECTVSISSADNPDIYREVKVIIVDSVPQKMKVNQTTHNRKTSVKLSWNATAFGQRYEVYRSENKDSGFKRIGRTYETYYYDDTAKKGKTYYYRVKSETLDWMEESNPYSKTVSIKIK